MSENERRWKSEKEEEERERKELFICEISAYKHDNLIKLTLALSNHAKLWELIQISI